MLENYSDGQPRIDSSTVFIVLGKCLHYARFHTIFAVPNFNLKKACLAIKDTKGQLYRHENSQELFETKKKGTGRTKHTGSLQLECNCSLCIYQEKRAQNDNIVLGLGLGTKFGLSIAKKNAARSHPQQEHISAAIGACSQFIYYIFCMTLCDQIRTQSVLQNSRTLQSCSASAMSTPRTKNIVTQ